MRKTGHANPAASHAASPPYPPPPAPMARWALFLDVDGCLLDLAATPEQVRVPESLVHRLAVWQQRLDGALALVSGRDTTTLMRLFAPLRLPLAGLHGAQFQPLDGVADSPVAPPALPELRVQAERLASVYDGALVEDKGAALALHWRQAPEAETALQAFARHSLGQLPGYQLQQGQQVVELRPASVAGEPADKGQAIVRFMQAAPFAGRQPVFAGDDLTDEAGFAVVNALGGVSVLVGTRSPSQARFHLPDPAAVRTWLGAPDPEEPR